MSMSDTAIILKQAKLSRQKIGFLMQTSIFMHICLTDRRIYSFRTGNGIGVARPKWARGDERIKPY